MKTTTKKRTFLQVCLILLLSVLMAGCSGNMEYVKDNAEQKWNDVGYEVVGYEGYQWGGLQGSFTNYGGARVWYQLRKIEDNGITYTGFLARWGDEIHVYNVTAIDAIKP